MTPRRRLPTLTVAALTVAALTVAALTALAACGNAPTSPGAVAGTYVVSAVDGEELPQHIGDDGGAPVSLVSLTITLADDATASLRATVRTKGAEGGVDCR
jgi:hypothetical protein